ncbi:hypothetical protein TH63_03275 [Rufibacter radiotolerans]|uniref:Uncharacterized protein n=1 Tax=Rufibacter radiotolerans TaxID=1379910 RepID=A0A0H4VGW8_9BACT|nr:hypothetical protein TH63_03275 [Rufibacter radiotolerans]
MKKRDSVLRLFSGKRPQNVNLKILIFPAHFPVSSLSLERLACGPEVALLREEGKEAARAVREGKTGPRGRERSEGEDETIKYKDLGVYANYKAKAECVHNSVGSWKGSLSRR